MPTTQAPAPGRLAAPKFSYGTTFGLLLVALFFPVALMVFNPTLMFERGWEQYVGTTLYAWAVVTLGRELLRLKADESAFAEAGRMLADPSKIAAEDRRVLPARLRGLASSGGAPVEQLMELNREGSGLDQEESAGRFMLTRYILYLLPVIGFIGTVEGISRALMNISLVLPMVKNLDGFMSNLTGVTSALQIAFDSTLLALFLSAALMLVQTLVFRRSDDLLARVDRWVVEHALGKLSATHSEDSALAEVARKLDELGERLGLGIGPHVDRFAASVESLPKALAGIQRGADAIERLGEGVIGGRFDVGRRPQGRGLARADRGDHVRAGRALRAARRHQAEHGPDVRSDRGDVGVVVDLVRTLQPRQPGAACADLDEPEGRHRIAPGQHGAGQHALSDHRQEDVPRDEGRLQRHHGRRGVNRPRGFHETFEGGHSGGMEFGGSGEDSFVAVVVTKLTGALLFILLLTMVIMALLPKAIDLPSSPGANGEDDAAAALDPDPGEPPRGHRRPSV